MRFHILGLPHTVTSKEFNACAYTQKVVKFGKMMTERGHEVIHYGHEDSDLDCTEHVTVLTNKDFEIAYGGYDWKKNFFQFNIDDYAYQTFYKNAIYEIHKRKKKHDFLLPFWGSGVRPICDAHQHDMIVVEPGIGYAGGHWARWKIFESYAIYHAYCGIEKVGYCNQDWYEVVIPNYFDLQDFEYCEEKEDYFLFLGRVFSGKGIEVAVQMTEKLGKKLIVAGQNPDNIKFPPHVEYIGYADVETRKRLLSRAKALIIASMYIEPFGGVQIEALLSGTPTITTDWGAFVENNINGLTGYRCRTFADFVKAGKEIDGINPRDCRKFAEKFSLENVAPMYEKYFQDVLNVHTGKGWYELEDSGRKFFFDCGTHLFQGFYQFREKIGIDRDWNVFCFESNPDVYEKSKSEYDILSNDGYNIKHLNLAVSDKTGMVKVNRILKDGEYVHLGSNILENPPDRDNKWDDDFEYSKDTVEVNSIRLSDVIRSNCKKEDLVVVKLDIEGSEFAVLDDIIQSKSYEFIDKIYVEFHSRFFENKENYDNKIQEYNTFFKENGVHLQVDGDDVVWDI